LAGSAGSINLVTIPLAVAMSGFQAAAAAVAGFSPSRKDPALIIACCEVGCGGFRRILLVIGPKKKNQLKFLLSRLN